jgi:hypothetical protein
MYTYKDNDHVDNQISSLKNLAKELHAKVDSFPSIVPSKVLCFVGAGPSKEANLPLAPELKNIIRNTFVSKDPAEAKIHDFLEDELSSKAQKYPAFENLTLFEFSAIISRFPYGLRVIRKVIRERLSTPSHRPLSYELMAHMAKHRYIDHFIILNFDHLLDDSLLDELPERVRIVASPHDIPPRSSFSGYECFAVHPFGILGEGSYSITPDDVAQFGPDPIRKFIEETLLEPIPSDRTQPITLILIGYRAEESAFSRFLVVQQDRWRQLYGQHRPIKLFIIDPDPYANQNVKHFLTEGLLSSVDRIVLNANDALELLFTLLRIEKEKSGHNVWISAARHRILSKIFSYNQLKPDNERFKIELLLQGLKSRGFIHLEAFGHIPRLKNYGSHNSFKIINELLNKDVIKRDLWQQPERNLSTYVPNFMIEDNNYVIEEFLRLAEERAVNVVNEWQLIDNNGELHAQHVQNSVEDFLKREIESIQKSPEIEIAKDVAPEVAWTLGIEAKTLPTIENLAKKTRSIIEGALKTKSDGKIKIYGIWSTGEWLFHRKGWAKDLGKKILRRKDVELKIIITRPGGVLGDRSTHREEVKNILLDQHDANVVLKWLNWWELNRILTLVCDKKGNCQCIYMRRRLSRPLVCPYFINQNATHALKYISELWDVYWDRGELAI